MVIGIHKGRKDSFNLAVQVDYVIEAVQKDYKRGPSCIPREPINFTKHADLEKILREHGLDRMIPQDPLLFTLRDQNIWFERTAHFWYYTSTEPSSTARNWCEWRPISSNLPTAEKDELRAIIQFLQDSADQFL